MDIQPGEFHHYGRYRGPVTDPTPTTVMHRKGRPSLGFWVALVMGVVALFILGAGLACGGCSEPPDEPPAMNAHMRHCGCYRRGFADGVRSALESRPASQPVEVPR